MSVKRRVWLVKYVYRQMAHLIFFRVDLLLNQTTTTEFFSELLNLQFLCILLKSTFHWINHHKIHISHLANTWRLEQNGTNNTIHRVSFYKLFIWCFWSGSISVLHRAYGLIFVPIYDTNGFYAIILFCVVLLLCLFVAIHIVRLNLLVQ